MAASSLNKVIRISADGTATITTFTKVGDEGERAFERVGKAAGAANQNLGRFGQSAKQAGVDLRGGLQQLPLQLQDIAIQAQSGTSSLVILAQQGPQILSAFGPIGAIGGLILGIGTAAVASMGLLGESTSAAEEATKEFESSLKGLQDAMGLTGKSADEMKAAFDRASESQQKLAAPGFREQIRIGQEGLQKLTKDAKDLGEAIVDSAADIENVRLLERLNAPAGLKRPISDAELQQEEAIRKARVALAEFERDTSDKSGTATEQANRTAAAFAEVASALEAIRSGPGGEALEDLQRKFLTTASGAEEQARTVAEADASLAAIAGTADGAQQALLRPADAFKKTGEEAARAVQKIDELREKIASVGNEGLPAAPGVDPSRIGPPTSGEVVQNLEADLKAAEAQQQKLNKAQKDYIQDQGVLDDLRKKTAAGNDPIEAAVAAARAKLSATATADVIKATEDAARAKAIDIEMTKAQTEADETWRQERADAARDEKTAADARTSANKRAQQEIAQLREKIAAVGDARKEAEAGVNVPEGTDAALAAEQKRLAGELALREEANRKSQQDSEQRRRDLEADSKLLEDFANDLRTASNERDRFIEEGVRRVKLPENIPEARAKLGQVFDEQAFAKNEEIIAKLEVSTQKYEDSRAGFIQEQVAKLDLDSGDNAALVQQIARTEEIAGRIYDAREAQEAWNKVIRDAQRTQEQYGDAIDVYRQRLAELEEQERTGRVTAEASARARREALEDLQDALIDQLEDTNDPFKGMQAGLLSIQRDAKTTAEFISDAMQEAWGQATDAIADFVVSGKYDLDSLDDALQDLTDDIQRMAIQWALNQAFAAAVGSFGPSPAPAQGQGAQSGSAFGNLFHQGGTVGDGGLKRLVDPMIFADARRFHSGGWPGLAANEVPAILEKGERVIPRGGTGGTAIQIIDQRGAGAPPIEEQRSTGPDGREMIKMLVRREVNETVASGGLDRTGQQRFNWKRKLR
jgi:hypothetical protein